MRLLRRRKPFIFVQEMKTLEDTKKLLTSKLQFLMGQTKLTFNSIYKSDLVAPEFFKNLTFLFDFQSKIIQSLIKLSSYSDLEWAFLQSWSSKDFRPYVFGTPNYSGFVIDTGKILKQSEMFFFELLKLDIIDVSSWLNMNKLKNYVDSVGLPFINDEAYFECKKMKFMSEVEVENNYSEINFSNFVGRSLDFKNIKPISFRFMKLIEKEGNKDLIASKLANYSFTESDIQTDKDLEIISLEQRIELDNLLNAIISFKDLCRVIFELSVSGKHDPKDSAIVKSFVYFWLLNKKSLSFYCDKEQIKYSFAEKMVHALLCVDFLQCLCRYSVNVLSSVFPDISKSFFLEFIKFHTSILQDKESFQMMLLADPISSEFIFSKVNDLRNNDFYKKVYAKNLDQYLAFIW